VENNPTALVTAATDRGGGAVAVAATMMRSGRCRACRLDLDPRAESCWFCSTPVPSPRVAQARAIALPAEEDESILFARGLLLGLAVVMIPFTIRIAALALAG
jgi:hypothetical protein